MPIFKIGLQKKALTLIELITVIIVIGIVAALAAPLFSKTLETARVKEAVAALRQIWTAQRIYRSSETSFYPYNPAGTVSSIDEIFSRLKVQLGSRYWNFAITTNAGGGFQGTATRKGTAQTIVIDENGNIDYSNWSGPKPGEE